MHYIKIFLLYFQDALVDKSRMVVWFLMSLFGPFIMILFWNGSAQHPNGWTLSSIVSYYLLFATGSSLLISHVEEDIAEKYIAQGDLVSLLLRPFSFFIAEFFSEIPYRFFQGSLGISVLILINVLQPHLIQIVHQPLLIFLSIILAICAYLVIFVFKMILGIIGFWVTEMSGIFEVVDILMFILGGSLLPLYLYPSNIERIATWLPFSYMVYYPVIAFQGKLDMIALITIIGRELVWLCMFIFIYKWLWKKGLYTFTGAGK